MSTKKSLPLSDDELEEYEAARDLYAELQQGLKEIESGLGRVVYSPLIAARKKAGLTQQQFAELLGVSPVTLENWEQKREEPSETAGNVITRLWENPEAIDVTPIK